MDMLIQILQVILTNEDLLQAMCLYLREEL